MAIRPELAALATELAALESDTFEIKDYAADGTALLGATSTSSTSTTSSTTSSSSTTG
jgi:thiazolylpeptide-type bacteriocin precursor